ncbi:protealysin inhibitor emfourin [Peribacillus frigoritolerans]|uniref:protealysin inhibitor emfourin n=1 Tax=Peribacillus frigoritolerans TaxID=450367 RepID=UPI002B24C185|nr:protealysin inhibitor emfourin [Peribacillus frigoritolerans]MEB2629410.1 protealysin inhibitor emfourin [Peribacillus frigoritolerans]
MHIKFSCIGGFANLDLNFEIDTDELPKEKYEELQNLMKQADLPNAAQSKMVKTQGFDSFSYQLDIADEKRKQSFSFTDISAPEEVRPLLDYLRNIAIEIKMAE